MSGEGKNTAAGQGIEGLLRGFLLTILALFVFVVLLAPSQFILEVPYHLVCGWAFHAWKAIPPFLEKWREGVLPLGCLVLAVLLSNRFIIRWAEKKRPYLTWKMRHTVAMFSLLLLCSGAAIAMSGVVHQAFWLGWER